jgi:hypothetical protein
MSNSRMVTKYCCQHGKQPRAPAYISKRSVLFRSVARMRSTRQCPTGAYSNLRNRRDRRDFQNICLWHTVTAITDGIGDPVVGRRCQSCASCPAVVRINGRSTGVKHNLRELILPAQNNRHSYHSPTRHQYGRRNRFLPTVLAATCRLGRSAS